MLFVNKEHKLSRSFTLFGWGPVQTVLGFVLLYIIASLVFGLLNRVFGVEYFVHNTFSSVGLFLIAIAYFYVMALAKVKEAHVGQPTLLGARRREFVLPEGYSLILPWPIMGYSEIPIQPTTTELKEPMEILVSNQPASSDDSTRPSPPVSLDQPLPYQVRMKVTTSILWEVEPIYILNYTAVEGGKAGVEKALVDLMRRAIREKSQHMSDTQVLTGQEAFETAIKSALDTELDDGSGLTLVHKLGIKISKVQTTKIVPSDEELTKRYERIRGEDLDREAETKQAKHIIENIAVPFKDKLGVPGDVALHSALAITKDAKLNVVTGNAGDFTKGQVAASDGGK